MIYYWTDARKHGIYLFYIIKIKNFVMLTSIVRLSSNRSYVRTNQNARITWLIIWLILEQYVPGQARMKGSMLFYFNGDCHSNATQQQIKENFIKLLKGSLFSHACKGKELSQRCIPENVKVVCGNTTGPNRGKRSINWKGNGCIVLLEYTPLVNIFRMRNVFQ